MTLRQRSMFILASVAFVWSFASLGCGGGGGGGQSCSAQNPPDVSGQWNVSDAVITDDSCPADIASVVADQIEGSVFDVTQDGSRVTLDDGQGDVLNGCVDDTGEVDANAQQKGSVEGCKVSISISFSGDLSDSPTSVTFEFSLHSSGSSCVNTTCMFTLDAQFRRASGAAQLGAGESSPAYLQAIDRALSR